MTPDRELNLFRFLESLSAHLETARDVRQMLHHAVRATMEFFDAGEGAIARMQPGQVDAHLEFSIPRKAFWDLATLHRFIRLDHPAVPFNVILAPVRRQGHNWAVLALRRSGGDFQQGDGRALNKVTAAISRIIETIDRDRTREVRDRIDRKIMDQLRPRDLFYQILDGLRSLTRYDHSSALLVRDAGDVAVTLVAEQIAWTKAKSSRIGLRLPLDEAHRGLLDADTVYGFHRAGDAWSEWDDRPAASLAECLDYNRNIDRPREGAMIVAPISTPQGVFGLLKIAGSYPESLTRYDTELVERIRSQVSIAIQNSQRAESLHLRMLQAEKKNAMADLARGVSHDVNNAIGSVLPIVQEIQTDLKQGRLDREVLARDMEVVHEALQVCRRIFGGMVSFARSGSRPTSDADAAESLAGALAILRDGIDRRGIRLRVEIPAGLPRISGGRSELEQVFLNLLTNARDAMPEGGDLTVTAREADGDVVFEIADTGVGIPEENLPRIQEPFFTTKDEGSGLGLSICRSIVWDMGGRMHIESGAGKGTRIRLELPVSRTAPEVVS